jgi:hypothetical protein
VALYPIPWSRGGFILRANLQTEFALADFVLLHGDSGHALEQLINSRPAYVSLSRGRYDPQIYMDDAEELHEQLSPDVSKQSALGPEHGMEAQGRGYGKSHNPRHRGRMRQPRDNQLSLPALGLKPEHTDATIR